MSADNWRACPRCIRLAVDEQVQRKTAARDSYGKVPIAEFTRLSDEADHPGDTVGETLREDYEFWLDDDGRVFHASYQAKCTRCDFEHRFQHEEPTSEMGGRL